MNAVSPPPADDERVPPLTAQQLGLCGPRSDDPGVGPDAARHTPPADSPDGDLAEAERLCRTRTLPGDARGALDVLLAEYDRRGTELARLNAVCADMNRIRNANRDLESELVAARSEYDRAGVASRQITEWRKAELAERSRLRDEIATLRGEKPHAAAVIDRMRESASEISHLRVALDVACAERDAVAARVAAVRALADDLPISEYAADQIRAVLDGPAFVGPAEAAEPAPRAWAIWDDAGEAGAPEPALIGTWADPEFRAHQDHKHAVDDCGYCPSEEDR